MDTSVPALVVLAPDHQRGQQIALTGSDLVVGRADQCDIRLPGPYVSRTHARLLLDGTTVSLEDLGSSSGTYVNGRRILRGSELHDGDVVRFADVQMRFQAVRQAGWGSGGYPVSPGPASNVRFNVDHQQGEAIHNVGRDQYHAYVQQVVDRREDFLREIAGTKTKARWLIWLGFFLFIAGFGLFAAGVLRFLAQGADAIENQDFTPPDSPFGMKIFGIPSGLLGWALAALGGLLLGIGTVLHIVATARRKRVDRELPLPAPWPPPDHGRGWA